MEVQGKHIWRFSRVGGVNRINIESGKDLLHLAELDQKLWTALSCPVNGLEIDEVTLQLIDSDKDGRIRVPEIIEAVTWMCSMITNLNILLRQEKDFPLSELNTKHEVGKHMQASIKQILENLGKPHAKTISVDDTSDTIAIFAKTKFNGDGIITVDSTDDKKLKKIIESCIATIGSAIDRSGNPGITEEMIESLYTECNNYSTWYEIAEADATIFPFGEKTEEALQIYLSVKSKVEDYFLRCRLAEFDPESAHVLNMVSSRYETISSKDITTCIDEIATYPLAKIEADKSLSLDKGLNPAWEKQILACKQHIISKILPKKNAITEAEWQKIVQVFEPYISWQSQKNGGVVESLGLTVIREILKQNKKEALLSLVAQDKALETEANNIFLVDKLVRYYRDLYTLLKNFVTFYDFYSPEHIAIFQTGTLFIDQRSCDLCIKVTDMPKHSLMAGQSGMFLMYCDCFSKTKNEKMSIVVAMTNGDINNLMVGKNAIFYDRTGQDWDATITKIIDNPISIRQAFWSPYRKLVKFIETQANKFAASKDNQVTTTATSNIEKTTAAAEAHQVTATPIVPDPPKAPVQPFDIGKFVGIFAAIGMALGAIGAVLASFISGFLGLTWWKMPIALVGIMLLISGPAMLMAWLKLRKRNIAPILDANGWAINARALVNITFGNTLTQIVKLPKNARIDLKDPFAAKAAPLWLKLIYVIVALGVITAMLWRFGYLVKWGVL